MKVLIIEDNKPLANNIAEFLEFHGMVVSVENNGIDGYNTTINHYYDVIVLDIMLPGMDGMEICKKLRILENPVPVLMLTSMSSKQDIVKGLDCGADDYLSKPFDNDELLARIKALYRRTFTNKNSIIYIGDIEIDLNKRTVFKGKKEIKMSSLEFNLLSYLAQNRGEPVDRRQLLEKVWGEFDAYMFSRTVDVYIGYLRKKLGKKLIQTQKGFGYVIL
ncbi:MAG: response regulator transcription factor [Candidatus Absconditabacteria bacterium]